MELALKLYDKTLGGPQRFVQELKLVSQRMTARQIIEARLDAEIAAINAQTAEEDKAYGSTLVVPAFVKTARSYGPPLKASMDRATQAEIVYDAFTANKLLMFVDNRQVTDLDQELGFGTHSTVTFIKLVPLVGG